jgi:hypothetical protein
LPAVEGFTRPVKVTVRVLPAEREAERPVRVRVRVVPVLVVTAVEEVEVPEMATAEDTAPEVVKPLAKVMVRVVAVVAAPETRKEKVALTAVAAVAELLSEMAVSALAVITVEVVAATAASAPDCTVTKAPLAATAAAGVLTQPVKVTVLAPTFREVMEAKVSTVEVAVREPPDSEGPVAEAAEKVQPPTS